MANTPTSQTLPFSPVPTLSIIKPPVACRINLDSQAAYVSKTSDFPGFIALGPTNYERDILIQCCRTQNTQLFSANGTDCLRAAACPVQECTLRDPAYTCVSIMRNQWEVNGTFACVPGQKKSGAGERKDTRMREWIVVVMVLAIAGISGF